MVRPQFGPSCFKTRPHSDGYSNMPHDEHYSRSQRGFRGQPGKGPSNWRDTRGRGRPQFIKRSPLMGERREQLFSQWSSPNQNAFHTYPSAKEPYHGNRKPSPARPNVLPPTQPRSSPMSPARTSPGERGASFHAHHSTRRSASPRHHHGQPPDRRPAPAPPLHRSFRGLHRGPNPSREDARGWGPWRHPGPMEDTPAARGGKRWNRRGGFAHSYNGERGPAGPAQRKPRELYARGPYPERSSSAERDPRKQHGGMGREMEGNAHYSGAWQQDRSPFHHPPYRPTPWKGGPPHAPFYHNSPQERPEGSLPQRKRCFPEHESGSEHNQPKHPRRDVPHFVNNGPRAFGGKPLSLRDKSRIIKGRKMRAESVMRLKAPPRTRDEEPKTAPKARPQEEGPHRSALAMRKERFQENAEPLRTRASNKTRQSPPNSDGNSSRSSRDSESAKEQAASRQALREHSSSPIDRLSKDLVVVSQWHAAPNSSSDERSSSRERTSKTKTERHFTSDGHPKPREHCSTIHVVHTSPKNLRGRYFDNQRQENMQEEHHRFGRSFREPGPPQRPGFYPGPRRTFSDPAGQFRKPLMGTFVPRQFPNQKPVFRKSQSIMSKYRNMQTLRQRVPDQREGNNRRW
ncbi:serine/arginine repetitive matrix protein 2 isoform X2 [Osmerus mordax]|uniref:serine/arginine repetitive matrix protein 2 isoform X2 n=1 Tax=Osmerus mordax TaxID=8014 RepID=UPI003510C4CD